MIWEEKDAAINPENWDYSKEPFKFVKMTLRDKQDHIVGILFNTVAYICNDAGKTIEVIRVDSYKRLSSLLQLFR